MLLSLLKHQWLGFIRSESFEREAIIKIILAVFVIYMAGNVIVLAIALPNFLIQSTSEPILTLHKGLFYYYVFELFIRYFIQSSPAVNLEPYLHLPINKYKISLYLQIKSLLHPLNFLAAVITGPFAFQVIAPEYGLSTAYLWWACIIAISIFLHFFMLIFRKKWEDSFITWSIIILVAAANYFMDSYDLFNLINITASSILSILQNPLYSAAVFLPLIGMAYYSYAYYKNNLYLEDLVTAKKKTGESYSSYFSFLGSYGISGIIILQEIKLIIRHKRSRTFLILSGFFMFYGLIFLDDYEGGYSPILIFLGIFITGIFMLNYGQLLWGWKTNLLDFYFTRPFPLHELVNSLYRLMVASCLIFGILSIPYVYFGWEVLAVFMSCMIYNMGINVPMIMRISLWKPSPMDIDKTAFMNYQGVGPAQWLMSIPVLALPFGIYYAVAIPFNETFGIIAIALTGIIGMILRRYIVQQIEAQLRKDKYQLVKSLSL